MIARKASGARCGVVANCDPADRMAEDLDRRLGDVRVIVRCACLPQVLQGVVRVPAERMRSVPAPRSSHLVGSEVKGVDLGLGQVVSASDVARSPGGEPRQRVDQLLLPGPVEDGADLLAGLVGRAAWVLSLTRDRSIVNPVEELADVLSRQLFDGDAAAPPLPFSEDKVCPGESGNSLPRGARLTPLPIAASRTLARVTGSGVVGPTRASPGEEGHGFWTTCKSRPQGPSGHSAVYSGNDGPVIASPAVTKER